MSLLGLPGLASEIITILALLILLKQTSPRQATLVASPCSDCRNCSIGVSGIITVAKKSLLGYDTGWYFELLKNERQFLKYALMHHTKEPCSAIVGEAGLVERHETAVGAVESMLSLNAPSFFYWVPSRTLKTR
ncbi:hypothetical protein EDB82DRAFT_480744 [Fusarium venenatum]|uniref:uncharacterized protein n=1 Tax=Fusarium venenatum TaxID=56646 RepID=UPI001D3F8174|nr:hypothetical protein EDB82DRAFT_480744 [Fusarium venenatum]